MVVCIVGPTAVGKSKVGIELASCYNSIIISADSRQVYRDMNIGTNKIKPIETQGVTHYLIDIIPPTEVYSAGRFSRDCDLIIKDHLPEKEILFIVGGTDLYIKAWHDGIDNIPIVSESIKTTLYKDYTQNGLFAMVKELEKSDPEVFQKIDLANPHRVLRALEVIRMTGEPYSSFLTNPVRNHEYDIVYFVIENERSILYQNINKRVIDMLDAGLLEEISSLLRIYPENLKAFNTIGYKEGINYLNGLTTYDYMVDSIQKNTRHYAKRQLTWQRTASKNKENYFYFSPNQITEMKEIIKQFMVNQ